MSEALSTMSLKKLFRFPFQETGWQSRFVVGSALMLANYIIPILPGIFVSGYALRVMRQALDGKEPTLPAWDEWGEMAGNGLRATAVGFVYLLPAILVFVGGMVLYFAGSFYLPLTMSSSSDPVDVMVAMSMATLGSMAVMFISMLVGMLLMLLGGIAVPVATAHFVDQGDLKAAFRVRQWWRILSADKLGYFVSWVVVAGLMGVLYMGAMVAYYTVILCCLVPILMAPISLYVLLVGSALFGQTYRESAAGLPAAAPTEAQLVEGNDAPAGE